jgi:hypothetical protein
MYQHTGARADQDQWTWTIHQGGHTRSGGNKRATHTWLEPSDKMRIEARSIAVRTTKPGSTVSAAHWAVVDKTGPLSWHGLINFVRADVPECGKHRKTGSGATLISGSCASWRVLPGNMTAPAATPKKIKRRDGGIACRSRMTPLEGSIVCLAVRDFWSSPFFSRLYGRNICLEPPGAGHRQGFSSSVRQISTSPGTSLAAGC